MANLEIVDRLTNTDTASVTLVLKDRDDASDPGAYYHYAADPPAHSGLDRDGWGQQIARHALALEARSRGIEPPQDAHPEPGRLGAGDETPPVGLSDGDRVELEQLRSADAAARDRAELERLRAASRETPTA